MTDPILDRNAVAESLRLVAEEATRYLADIDGAPVRPPGPGTPAETLAAALPEDGVGSLAALRGLAEAAQQGTTRSAGPRFFHFVMGGGTPAALGADWLTSALDQIAFNWVSSPFAMRLEQVALG
jgi:glutamate/tyrosine decarboxylase-like PLP-dependent enzyme